MPCPHPSAARGTSTSSAWAARPFHLVIVNMPPPRLVAAGIYHLAAGPGGQRQGGRRPRVGDELDRAVGEEPVAAVGVQAPEVVAVAGVGDLALLVHPR